MAMINICYSNGSMFTETIFMVFKCIITPFLILFIAVYTISMFNTHLLSLFNLSSKEKNFFTDNAVKSGIIVMFVYIVQ